MSNFITLILEHKMKEVQSVPEVIMYLCTYAVRCVWRKAFASLRRQTITTTSMNDEEYMQMLIMTLFPYYCQAAVVPELKMHFSQKFEVSNESDCSLIPWTINARLNLPSSIIEGYSSTQIMTKKLTQTKILVQTRADKYLVLENDFKL